MKDNWKIPGTILDMYPCYCCDLKVEKSRNKAVIKVEIDKNAGSPIAMMEKETSIKYFCGLGSKTQDCSLLNIYKIHSSHTHGIKGTRCYKNHNQEPTPCKTTEPK